MTAKEILASIKAVFDGPVPAQAAPPVAPTAPASPTVPAPVVYTLVDGTQIAVNQAGALPAPGDTVTIGGAPAPEGVLTLQDGTMITVDATGTVTQYAPVAPAASAAPAAAPAAPAPTVPVTQSAMSTQTDIKDTVAKFAVGDPEQRLTNLEVVCKALMESEFGYQISANERIESANQAIAIYQTTLQNQSTELEAAKVEIAKYGKVIEGLFGLVEKLVELPTAEPRTLTGQKKEKFDRANSKEEKLNKMAAAIAEMRKGKS